MINIKKIEYANADEILEESDYIFTSKCWIDFLICEKCGDPIILEIDYNLKKCFFVGLIFKTSFLKICGSPFEGWSSQYMGFIHFDLFNEDEKMYIIKNTVKFLFKKEKCSYCQICDWNIDYSFAKKYHLKFEISETPYLDISSTEEELYSSFENDVRRNCRRFDENDAELKFVQPNNDFVKDYYSQLIDVFSKQNLKPSYPMSKVENLMTCFSGYKDNILCETVNEPSEGKSIATGIFLAYKKRMYFFGLASYREYQFYKPSEIIIWSAIKYWKDKGCSEMDMIGTRKYKEKFKPTTVTLPIIYFSKIPGLHLAKLLMKKMISLGRKK